MNKIDKIIDSTWNLNRNTDEDGNSIYYTWEVLKLMKEFGELCFNAGREIGDIESFSNFNKYNEYEDFLKSLEDDTRD